MSEKQIDQQCICVVRLKTEYFTRGCRSIMSICISEMSRLSKGNHLGWWGEEVDLLGVEDALKMVVNLHDCEDGLYYLTTANETFDRDSGHLDSYDLKLIAYEKGEQK